VKSSLLSSRQSWLRLFALATNQDLENMVKATHIEERCKTTFGPQTGIVTVRARISGKGQKFNVGDACVTKAEVLFDHKVKGYATVMGGQARRAQLVAMLDAAMASEIGEPLASFVYQLDHQLEQRKLHRQRSSANTKVNFFTMVRGE
jgi:alpha-D-ribose 1-methylphosphonate 5-triphosphate synthase subunit PhnG